MGNYNLQNNNVKANKKLGQHFLKDQQICDFIAMSYGDLSSCNIIEVGPGTGNLTRSILKLHRGVKVVAVETDTRFISILREIEKDEDILRIVEADALKYDFRMALDLQRKNYIIGNLPYNIGTELVFKWLEADFLKELAGIVVMLQKEVIDRIAAQPKSKAYGWLGILSQLLCEVEILFDVSEDAFDPPPKVISSVVSLIPRHNVLPHNLRNLKLICRTLFMNRRKTVGSILKKNKQLSQLIPVMESLNISLKARPEEISIEEFCNLSLNLDRIDKSVL